MKSEAEIAEMLATLEADEVIVGPTATTFENEVVALMQAAGRARIATLRYILELPQREYDRNPRSLVG